MTIIQRKINLRELMFSKRNGIEKNIKKNIDHKICEILDKKISEKNAKTVHLYLPIGSEIDLFPLIDKLLSRGVIILCPKALPNRILENRQLHSILELESGPMGTKHPIQKEIFKGEIDFIIVPGLAFDHSNYRLGYGGGYYDIFLASQPKAHKIGAFYSFQKVDQVPCEEHDIKLDEIVTEK